MEYEISSFQQLGSAAPEGARPGPQGRSSGEADGPLNPQVGQADDAMEIQFDRHLVLKLKFVEIYQF